MPLILPKPRLGPAARRNLDSQPDAALIEPSPLETAEERRGDRDDVIREAMAGLALLGRSAGIPEEELDGYGTPEGHDAELKLYRLLAGHYRHQLMGSHNIENSTAAQEFGLVEHIRDGFIFIARGLRAMAPAGSKLQLYEQSKSPSNFREVVTSVQEFSGEMPGTCVFEGPTRVVAVILGATEAGQAVVRLEGDLVPREFIPRV
jgi:hypothetical protein